jgi:hypothetical protein
LISLPGPDCIYPANPLILKILLKNKLAWNLGFTGLLYLYGRMVNIIKKSGWFLFFVVLASSCLDEPDCYSLNNNIVGIAFRKMSDGQADTVFFKQITVDGTDSVYKDVFRTGLDLPLNYYQNETSYHFEGQTTIYDLHFGYTAKTQLVSEDCGERFVLGDLVVTAPAFDSLRLVARTPKRVRQTGTHLYIYRCPNTSRIELKFAAPVTITAASADFPGSFLLNTAAVTTQAVPLNTAADQSTITLTFGDVVKVLTVSYSRTESTLFKVCGPQTVLSNIDVVSTDFTSATSIRKTIQDPLLTNIEITF